MSRFPCNVFTAPVGNKKSLALILIVILVGTIGNSGCLFSSQASASDSSKKKKVSKKKKSKSQKKNAPEEKIEDGETVGIGIPNDKNVKEIIELQPFIVNLADQDESRYLRLSVSLGIGESKEEKPSQLFKTRVQNVMLSLLTKKRSDEVRTLEGKNKLKEELLEAAQAVSEELPVEAVYITDFIIQL